MLKRKNKGIRKRKLVKSVGVVAIQLSVEEIKEFDMMYSLFDVNFDI
ncbi:hypothetical protein K9O30_11155 [Clostridium bowmanii]|nr:hypothetical protein [Clostridium bowmanii]MBU3189785.1 hypothetical protein [Clostridium bowmanii]MCA1074268.1 hypothetical protein [Clostridium bowmanii]